MKKIGSLALCLASILALAFRYKKESLNVDGGYILIGVVHGYPDSTKLYLDCEYNGLEIIDSTLIIQNHFKFSGTIKSKVVQAILHTANFSDYKYFWLENNDITFKA